MSAPTIDPARRSGTELPAGTMVGEYRIDRRIAAGGMGTVYAAQHPVIGKRAAVKVLHVELALAPNLVQRFIDEARAVNQIRHPHIVDIFAFGALPDGRQFFVMEWLDGETLAARLSRGPLSFLEGIDVLLQLCDALTVTHAKGIIHRDLKPDNVVLTTPGGRDVFVKLLDFGIAKLSDRPPDSSSSQPGLIVGTPDYISPEQAQGEETGPPADVYSLGVLAYELLLGRRPFVGKGPFDVIAQHLSKPPPPAEEIWPEVSPAVSALIRKMLEKAPGQRPPIAHVKAAFEQIRGAARLDALTLSVDARQSARPMAVRTFGSISALVRTLWRELAAGVGWVEITGRAPPSGTPVLVRFGVPKLGLELDLGAVLGGALGTEGAKALLRYDRLPKPDLDRLTEVVAANAGASGEDGDEGSSRFEAPRPRRRSFTRSARSEETPDLAKPASWSSGLMPAVAPAPTLTPRIRVKRPRPLERLAKQLVAPPVEDRSRIGLGAKFLGISVTLVVLAVASVTTLALGRAEEDRQFYLQDLNLRTAKSAAQALVGRLEAAEAELTIFSGAEAIDRVGAWARVTVCNKTCRALSGEAIQPERIEALRRDVSPGKLRISPFDGDEIAVLLGTDRGFVIGTLPPSELLVAADLAPDLGTVVWDPKLGVLAARPASLAARFSEHTILAAAASPAGAMTYLDPSQRQVLGAFAHADELVVFALTPIAVGSEQNRVLARQVIIVASIVLLLASISAIVFARALTARLRRLADHSARIARGDFAESPRVTGKDEVGLLARSFERMATSLKERDQQVLVAQRRMTEVESRAVQRQVSEWLERDLAEKIHGIRSTLEREVGAGLTAARPQLLALAEQASQSLQSAVMFASLGTARVDLYGVVADAVGFMNEHGPRRDVDLALEAQNAVLFPRLDAPESVAREVSIGLLSAAAEAAPKEGLVDVNLALVEGDLVLDVVLEGGSVPALERSIGSLAEPLAALGAKARVEAIEGLVRVRVLFSVKEAS